MTENAKLQIALDEMHLSRCLDIADEAVKGGADWLEAGTPLIKSEGVEAVRQLKKRFPNSTIVADMKVMDTGGFEVEIAAKAGADIVCVLGVADDGTIEEAVRSARNYGARIMVDLINSPDPVASAQKAERLGADYVCLHLGIDQQMKGISNTEILSKIVRSVRIPVAAAGGINSETAADVVMAGASIVVVGGAVTKAANARKASLAIRKAIDSKKAQPTEEFRKYSEKDIIKAFQGVSTCNISDAMHREGAMNGIHQVYSGMVRMIGPAFTASTMDGDWAKPVEAIEKAKEGDVLVIDARPGNKAVWGELATNSCAVKKIAGVVIDGAVRDKDSIAKLGIPVYSTQIRPNAGDPKGHGELNTTITCGGCSVSPGDWIIGDASGLVVVPRARAVEVANRALDVKERENRIREEIQRGKTLSEVLDILKWEQVG